MAGSGCLDSGGAAVPQRRRGGRPPWRDAAFLRLQRT